MNKAQSTTDQGTKKSNAVAEKVAAGALAVSLFEEDADKGLGNIGHEDLALPFLKILGQLSPEVNKRDGKYVQGAEPGMIYNSVTGELFDGEKGINVLPCHYKLEYIEWQERGEGSGAPVGIHPSSSDIMTKTKRDASFKDRLSNGNYVERTASYFLIVSRIEVCIFSAYSKFIWLLSNSIFKSIFILAYSLLYCAFVSSKLICGETD